MEVSPDAPVLERLNRSRKELGKLLAGVVVCRKFSRGANWKMYIIM
jgi:hypothetical protein